MIAVDTNILVRYFTGDDPVQTRMAKRLLEDELSAEQPAFIGLVTLVELLWVLGDTYKIGQAMQLAIVEEMLDARNFVIEREDLVQAAVRLQGADIADRIIHLAGVDAGCSHTVTFDKRFARLPGVELLA